MDITNTIKAIQAKLGVAVDGAAGPDTWLAIYNQLVGAADFAETRDINTLVVAVQEALGIALNGEADESTLNAVAKALGAATGASTAIDPSGDLDNSPADARSEGVITTLLPEVQPYARTLVHKAAEAGITIKVISGLRTYAEQDALFAQGRTKPGPVVTNAPAGHSNHNFGLAFDIGIFEGNQYLDESPKYKTVGNIGVGIGLAWGGNWTSIKDEPHFELRPSWADSLSESDMLAALRQRKEDGQDFFA